MAGDSSQTHRRECSRTLPRRKPPNAGQGYASPVASTQRLSSPAPQTGAARADDQLSLSDVGSDEVRKALLKTDINSLSPIEALNLLYELQQKARG